jgi:hypothetical protein
MTPCYRYYQHACCAKLQGGKFLSPFNKDPLNLLLLTNALLSVGEVDGITRVGVFTVTDKTFLI